MQRGSKVNNEMKQREANRPTDHESRKQQEQTRDQRLNCPLGGTDIDLFRRSVRVGVNPSLPSSHLAVEVGIRSRKLCTESFQFRRQLAVQLLHDFRICSGQIVLFGEIVSEVVKFVSTGVPAN